MTYTKIAEINCETGEETLREMNANEKKDYDLRVAKQNQSILDAEQAATDKAALLVKLGITAVEAKLLLS